MKIFSIALLGLVFISSFAFADPSVTSTPSTKNTVELSNEEMSALLDTVNPEKGCLIHYEAKLKRMKDRSTLREIGKAAVIVGGTGLFVIGPIPALNLLVGTAYEGVIWIYMLGGEAVTGLIGHGIVSSIANRIDREETLTAVHDLLIASTVSEKTLQDTYFEKRVNAEVVRLNRYKRELNQPPLTESEIETIRLNTPYGKRDETRVDEFMKSLSGSPHAYNEVRLAILQLNEEEALCPSKKNGKRKLLGHSDLVKRVTQLID